MPSINLEPVQNWARAAEVDSAATSLEEAASDFAQDGRSFSTAFTAMADMYRGGGSAEFRSAGPSVQAMGEGARTFLALAVSATQDFVSALEAAEPTRSAAETLGTNYNLGDPVNRFYRFFKKGPTELGLTPDFERVANEPADMAGQAAAHPEYEVRLSSFRATPGGYENNVARHQVPGRTLANSPTFAEVRKAIEDARTLYDEAVTAYATALTSLSADSDAFRSEFSSDDDSFDGAGSGLLGWVIGEIDSGVHGPDSNIGPRAKSIWRGIAGPLGWIDLVLAANDNAQDAQQRAAFSHPEWSPGQRSWSTVQETVIRTGVGVGWDKTIGLIPNMLGPGLLGMGILSQGGDAVADWAWHTWPWGK